MLVLGKLKFSLFILLLSYCAFAQSAKPSDSKTTDPSQEAAIVQLIKTSVRLENDGSGVIESMLRAKMHSQAGAQQFGLLTFNYMKDVEKLDVISVTVQKPDGTVVETPADSIQDMVADVSHDAPFFTGLREKHVPVKSLSAGDVLEYHVKETYSSPLIPNQFWYQHDFTTQGVVLAEEFTLNLPKNRAILLKSEKLKPAVTEELDRKIYKWNTSHPEAKDKTPPMLAGHLPSSDVEVSSFASWAELGKWMSNLYRDRAVPTPEIAAKAQQLTKDAKSDEDKIKALYKYLSLQFRYTGIAIGPGRWQPHTAADVFGNEFGDCKDKHTLLAAMLKAVGIQAYPVLVNSAHVLDTAVPSPAQFDHVMTYIPREKEPIWLDTTQEVAPYGYIVFAMRDKQGLVLDDQPHLEAVPAKDYESWEEFHADTTLSTDGTLEGELTREARGDAEMIVRGLFRRVGTGKYRDVIQNMSYVSGFAGSVSDVVVGATEDTSTPLKITYHYIRKDFSDWENRRITPPMPPLGLPAISQEPERANDPIIIGQPNHYRYYSKVKLPKGYSAVLPQNIDLSRDFAEYHVKYDLQDGALYAERLLKVKQPIVKSEQLESYKTFRKSINDDLERYIVLTETGSESGSAESTLHTPSPEAIQLVEQARNAFNMRDMAGAKEFMRRALDKDPKIENGWAMLASAQAMTGEKEQALASLRKQVEVTPKNFAAYRMLGAALEQEKKREDAIGVWRQLLSLDPENVEAISRISTLQYSMHRYADSVSELEAGLKKNPDNPQLLMLVAQSYLKIGQQDKAIEISRKLLEKDPSPDTLNSVSYYLTDANIDLDESLKWAKEAVEMEEGRRLDVNLSDVSPKDTQHAGTLMAYWDTLGWVYFRRGEHIFAEKYLRASWTVAQDSVVGFHLAELYEKQHRTRLAAKTLAQAYVAGLYKDEDKKKHLEKLVGISEAGRLIGAAGSELSLARTFKISAAGLRRQSSDFWVLLSPAKVEQVRMLSSSEQKLQNALMAAKFGVPFPSANPVKIVRKGIVFCSGGPTCDVVLYPLSSSTP